MNYSNKELVRSFDWSDFHSNRYMEKVEIINGRKYYKTGTRTAVSIVGDLYKVNDPSNNNLKYVLLVGVSRQHPCDVKITYNEGIETAAINAKIKPVMVINFPSKIEWETFCSLAETYAESLPVQFIKTHQELVAEGRDASKYIR